MRCSKKIKQEIDEQIKSPLPFSLFTNSSMQIKNGFGCIDPLKPPSIPSTVRPDTENILIQIGAVKGR